MATILVVDDDRFFLEVIKEGLESETEPRLEILAAASAAEALELLDRNEVELLLTDLRMPETDGFALIAKVARLAPQLPVIAMTACLEPGTHEQAYDTGAWLLVEKPIDLETLREKIVSTLQARLTGRLSGVTVASFLQLLELERKSCSLRVRSRGREGRFFFAHGRLVHAHNERATGRQAALEMVSWNPAELEIDARPPPPLSQGLISEGLQELVLEGLRLHDERQRDASAREESFSLDLTREDEEEDGWLQPPVATVA